MRLRNSQWACTNARMGDLPREPMGVTELLAPHFSIPKQAKHMLALAATAALTAPPKAKPNGGPSSLCANLFSQDGVAPSLIERSKLFVKRDYDALLADAITTSNERNKSEKTRTSGAPLPGGTRSLDELRLPRCLAVPRGPSLLRCPPRAGLLHVGLGLLARHAPDVHQEGSAPSSGQRTRAHNALRDALTRRSGG